MKKKILSGIFALALLGTAGYGVSQTMKSDTRLSDLALANVEALAQNENPDFWLCEGIWGYCTLDGGYQVYGYRVG